MNSPRTCPSCGRPLGPDAPQGLCPECLLKAGFPTNTQPAPDESGPSGRGFRPPTPAELAPLFPQLEILECIGQGGMGAVYKARQPSLDRMVALKILPPRAATDPGFAERFTREARALARLSHPHIVAVHDFGQAGGFHYLTMEFVDGANLRQLLGTARIAPREALAIVPQICDALQYAHDQGIVHRDIKPENILLSRAGVVKIADFGLAKLVGAAAPDATITAAGDVMGTPHYMAPEQVERPQAVDHRADIYSLGVVFYQMLTGELPLGRFGPPSRKVQVDVRLDEVVLRALAKEPELRYQQASALKLEVETIAASGPGDRAANVRADGRLLVLPVKGATFPLRCIFTNEPVTEAGLQPKAFAWVPSVIWLSLLLTPIAFVILFGLFRQTVAADIPVSAKGRREVWFSLLPSIGPFIVGVVLVSVPSHEPWRPILGIVALVAAVFYLLLKLPVLHLVKVEAGEAWLAGAGPKFLATLPSYRPGTAPRRPSRLGALWWKSGGLAAGLLVLAALVAAPWLLHRRSIQALAKTATVNGRLVVNVAADGTIAAGGRKVTAQEFAAIASEEARWGRSADVVIVAGEDAPFRVVTQVMDTLRKAGVSRFSISSSGPAAAAPRARGPKPPNAASSVAAIQAPAGTEEENATVLRLRREQAERNSALMEERYRAGLADSLSRETARQQAEMARAKEAGDPVGAARADLALAAYRQRWAASQYRAGLVNRNVVDDARTAADIARVRLLEAGHGEALFGPVTEELVGDIATRESPELIDLETGELFFQKDILGADSAIRSATEAAVAFRAHGIDATGTLDPNTRGLAGWECIALPTPSSAWDTLTPEQLAQSLAGQRAGSVAVMMGTGPLPVTYAVKTRSGSIGLLQILGFSDRPRGVRIRYKLVLQPSAAHGN